MSKDPHGEPATRDRHRGVVSFPYRRLLRKPAAKRTDLVSAFGVSFLLHVVVLLVLSWIYFELPRPEILETFLTFVMSEESRNTETIELDTTRFNDVQPEIATLEDPWEERIVDDKPETMPNVASDLPIDFHPGEVRIPKVDAPVVKSATPKSRSSTKASARQASSSAAADPGEHTNHFVGRSPKARAALIKKMGGTEASEAAVAKGLVWLKNHQLSDGSWNFFHLYSPGCDCTLPGRMDNNPNAATAMALLAFLGAGQTHEEGDYQSAVKRGIDFLLLNGIKADKGICFYGQLTGQPTYYTHGLVTIAFSEAFAMTGDPELRPAITGAIEYLVATQDSGGGWRYFPGQPGDTSVVGWQLMALKSAQFSRVAVPQKVFTGIDRFINSVSSQRGTRYAYLPDRRDSPTPCMTAVGLLCRMYLEWEDNGRMQTGIRALSELGPDRGDMYYNYYATQVMHHWGGPEWEQWNKIMREHLIQTQITEGHASGSWDVADRHGSAGGRLYMTTLALMTLEVYYRHLPLYQKDRIEVPLLKPSEKITSP